MKYLRGTEAKEALIRGVRLVKDAVAPTLGPTGKDALIEQQEWPYSIATNDGATIAEHVKSEDAYEQMGVRVIQEAMGRANRASGDGSTTTCVLTSALLEAGYEAGLSKKDFESVLPQVLDSLTKQSKPIAIEDVWKVATVSAESEEMGKLLGDIFTQIGKDGVVTWDNAHSEETSYEIKPGIEFHGVRYVHQSQVNANAKGPVANPFTGDRIIVTNPYILLASEKIHSINQLEPYVSSLAKQGIRELVVVGNEIEAQALAEIEMTCMGIDRLMRTKDPFKIIYLDASGYIQKDWLYEDMALMTGATVFGGGGAAHFKGAASLSWLGTCEKVIARRGGIDFIGIKDISDHIKTLEAASKDYQMYEKRVEWLNSKSAIVKLGSRSEVELSKKRLKLDDAWHSTQLALRGGVLIGGGEALAEASLHVQHPALKKALLAPKEQILANGHVTSKKELEEQCIYDPTDLVKNAVKAAFSVAGTVLDCETLMPYETHQTM